MNHRVLSHGRPGMAGPGPRALLCSPTLFSWFRSGFNSWLRPALLGCLMLMGFFTPSATAQSWNNTGSLTGARSTHTATLLGNGLVLVTGGAQGASRLNSCELYDPATGTWTPTGSMATARQLHTATLLSNGKVLVAGGYNGSNGLNSCELYDPATGTWSSTASLATARYYHTATLLNNGLVLVTGGTQGPSGLTSCEIYDPATNIWSPTASLAGGRYVHTATLLSNGKVLVTGGFNSSVLNSCELYDPTTNTWSPTGSMTAGRVDHRATLLSDGRVLVTGGTQGGSLNSCELYDPATNIWSLTGSMAGARYVHTATLLSNGKVLVAGGFNSSNSLNSCELYDPATGTWSPTTSLAGARYGHTATLLGNGLVLVAGGTQGGSLNSSELYTRASTAPILTNTGLTLNERTSTTISTSNLNATDNDGDGGPLTFTLTSVPAQGTLKLDNVALAQSDTFTPADIAGGKLTYTHTGAGNDSFGFSLSDGFSTAPSSCFITVTPVPPVVSSVTRLDANPTNASSVRFTVTFSEAVTGVDEFDFITNTALTGAVVTGVTGSGTTYTVTVHTGTDQYNLTLYVIDDDSIVDVTGNPLSGAGIANGNYTSGQFYQVDHVYPTVTINQAAGQSDPTAVGSVEFTVLFNEPVTGFTATDVALVGTSNVGTANVQVDGSGTTYTVTVSGLTKAGTVMAFIGASMAQDAVGNPNNNSTSTDNSVTFGHVPTALSLSRSSVQEKLPVGSFVGLLSSTDSDAGESFTYSLVGGDTSAFAIDGAYLRTNEVLDEAVKNSYNLTIRTTDNRGLWFEQPFAISVLETTKPEVSISSPSLGQKVMLNALTGDILSGTATDNKGVVAVKVRLSRKIGTSNEFWNGTSFGAAQAWLSATLSPSVSDVDNTAVNWTLDGQLPPADKLVAGAYAIQVYALDAANNKSAYANATFSLVSDAVPPTLSITTPTTNQKLLLSDFNSSAISGATNDDLGVASVKVRLSRKRGTSNEYWNGTAFTTASAYVDATVAGTSWSLGAATPAAGQLDTGAYLVEAYALDGAGNKSASAKVAFTLNSDYSAPSVSILTPTSSQVIKINEFGANVITGTAGDNIGVTSVKLKLQRKRGTSYEYWNGTAFTTTVALVDATYSSGNWSYDTAIPASALDAGGYTVYATAYDAAGNKTTSASRQFSVVGTPSATGAVSVADKSAASS